MNLPPNCVHGWIYLDDGGRPLPRSGAPSASPPLIASCQLLFVDGRVVPGMFCAQVLPRFSGNAFYSNCFRPFLVFLLEGLVSLRVVQWCLSCTFGVLLCRVQPPPLSSSSPSCGTVHIRPTTQGDSSGSSNSQRCDIEFHSNEYTSWEERMKPLQQALATVRTLCQEFNLQSDGAFWYFELLPGPVFLYCCSDVLFSWFYKCFLGTYYHYCGTCKMASPASEAFINKDGVVDESLRVLGVECLRIADASVFPWIPSGPIAATAMAVGVNAAHLILQSYDERNFANI